ncbi:MAG TPA: amidase [Steroidobacteraceae bacterium]|nr:amidase [Steroidobacteraceae bacterium]
MVLAGAAVLCPFAGGNAAAAIQHPGTENLYYESLQETGHLIAAREVSPVDLTHQMLDRIAKLDPILRSYATVMHDQALADAQAASEAIHRGEYRGPLHGMPIAVKDLFYTKGVRTMGGSAIYRTFVPTFDTTAIARLRSAGAVVLGKLNLTEGATAGYSPTFDVPRNPWNIDYWPGLSSSGSGVATAAGLCFASLGTDTGGSIRFPSSADGIVGLKPTYGRVSRFGVLTFAQSLDHVGPMGRSVADVAIMFDAIAGHDPNDPTSLKLPPPNVFAEIGRGARDMRIGIDRKYALEGVDEGNGRAIEEALKVLSGLGAKIVDVRMPDLKPLLGTWQTIAGAEIVQAHVKSYPSRATEFGPYLHGFLDNGARHAGTAGAGAQRSRRADGTVQQCA